MEKLNIKSQYQGNHLILEDSGVTLAGFPHIRQEVTFIFRSQALVISGKQMKNSPTLQFSYYLNDDRRIPNAALSRMIRDCGITEHDNFIHVCGNYIESEPKTKRVFVEDRT